MSTDNKWKRPDNVPLPTVWRRYEGRLPMKNGKRPRFVIQDATPELDDAILEHMQTHFLRDETVCAQTRMLSDPAAVRDWKRLWRGMLDQRAVLVALLEDDAGCARRVVGANLTEPVRRSDRHADYQFESEKLYKIFAAYDYAVSLVKPDVFTRYGVDLYLTALGLSVDSEYRGQGLGEQLLRARWDLCKAFEIPLTVTWFTAIASQDGNISGSTEKPFVLLPRLHLNNTPRNTSSSKKKLKAPHIEPSDQVIIVAAQNPEHQNAASMDVIRRHKSFELPHE